MLGWYGIANDMEGSDVGTIKLLSWRFVGGNRGNHKKH
jgi:hypothetical protein